MSRYTVMLRWIIEAQQNDYHGTLFEKIQKSASDNSIFIRNYPIWDESDRVRLNTEIINHYLYQEIGLETVALWKDRLAERMDLIMPKYNKMYKALSAEFNILENVNTVRSYTIQNESKNNTDRTEENKITRENITKSSQNGSSTANSTDTQNNSVDTNIKHSDYPQSDISSGDYLSNEDVTSSKQNNTTINKSDGKSSNEINENFNGTDSGKLTGNENTVKKESTSYSENYSGLNGYPVDFLEKYLSFVKNIDQLIIDELHDLFMLIY